MRFSPIVLLLFAMLGCGSESPPANEVDRKAREQDVETIVENKSSPATSAAKPVETQEQAIAAIKKLGGEVSIARKSKLTNVNLRRTKVTNAGLVHLKGLPNLQWLSLNQTEVTDAGLVHLKELTKLIHVDLSGTKVSDAGLEHLKGLTNLQTLNLNNTKVTDEGVKKLQTALPRCRISH